MNQHFMTMHLSTSTHISKTHTAGSLPSMHFKLILLHVQTKPVHWVQSHKSVGFHWVCFNEERLNSDISVFLLSSQSSSSSSLSLIIIIIITRCPMSHFVVQTFYPAAFASLCSLNYSGMCLASDTQFSDFLDGMGPAQFVGRQTLATTSMGERRQLL